MHQTGSEPSGTVFQPRRHLHDAVARYHRPLVAYALSQTGDLERARDAAQDTLLRLCQQPAERLEHDILPKLAPWLFTVCRNRVIDLHRKESHMTATPGMEQGAAATEPGPAEHAEAHDQKRRLLGLVASLPTRHREVVQLRFQGGLSYKDIAKVTGYSVSYVGVLLHEAMASLRQQLTALNA
ncbi:MAG: sigma-70 family RNA polymerase sigma factor [Planctomycetota bacterium]